MSLAMDFAAMMKAERAKARGGAPAAPSAHRVSDASSSGVIQSGRCHTDGGARASGRAASNAGRPARAGSA